MAEEKTILTVDLYDNVLTEKTGDFTGKIRITGTTRTSDISNRIVKNVPSIVRKRSPTSSTSPTMR